MTYDNKVAIVIRNDLPEWQKLNVASFLASAVAIQFPDTHGKAFVNASNVQYLPFIKHPILIEIAKYTDEEQDLAGIVIYGENKKVSKALDGLKFHS